MLSEVRPSLMGGRPALFYLTGTMWNAIINYQEKEGLMKIRSLFFYIWPPYKKQAEREDNKLWERVCKNLGIGSNFIGKLQGPVITKVSSPRAGNPDIHISSPDRRRNVVIRIRPFGSGNRPQSFYNPVYKYWNDVIIFVENEEYLKLGRDLASFYEQETTLLGKPAMAVVRKTH